MDSNTRKLVFDTYQEIWQYAIPRDYSSEWEKFRELNLLADENDFLEIHIAQIQSLIDGFKRKIDFNDDPEENLTERPNLYDYWYYKKYLEYLNSRTGLTPKAEITSDFRAYLSEAGVKLLPSIIRRYKGAKPKQLALMLHCLQDYGLLNNSIRTFKQDALTTAVKDMFDIKELSRQSLFYGVERYEMPNLSEQAELKEEKLIIHKMTKGFIGKY